MQRRKLFERRCWAALLLTVGCLLAAVPVSAEEVKIDNFTFDPPEITVKPGTTITWINEDDIPHTVVAQERAFRSKTLDTDDKFSFTFTTPGAYDYFCSLHPHMVGKIIVRAQTGEALPTGPSPKSGASSIAGTSLHAGHH